MLFDNKNTLISAKNWNRTWSRANIKEIVFEFDLLSVQIGFLMRSLDKWRDIASSLNRGSLQIMHSVLLDVLKKATRCSDFTSVNSVFMSAYLWLWTNDNNLEVCLASGTKVWDRKNYHVLILLYWLHFIQRFQFKLLLLIP